MSVFLAPKYRVTSPLPPLFEGHLHSGETRFVPEKMFTQSLYLLPLLKGHLYLREKDTISRSQNPALTSIQGHLSTLNMTDHKKG